MQVFHPVKTATIGLLLLLASPAAAQTVIPRWDRPSAPIRDRDLLVTSHQVDVSVTDGVVDTAIDQVFHNPYPYAVEGTYLFPLPDHVAISRFSMFIDGKEIEGELLEADEARKTYEAIVSRMRDPALLEYVGNRLFRARVFPIQPDSDARIRMQYSQVLDAQAGLFHYTYPLGSCRRLAHPIGSFVLNVTIQSQTPIKSLFSNSHSLAVNRKSDHKLTGSFEANNLNPEKDFEFYYSVSDREFGLTLLTWRKQDQDGFFLARIMPPASPAKKDVVPKDICFVIDTSGSMRGGKIEQARKSLLYALQGLKENDRFNIIPFSHEPVPFREAPVSATEENVNSAIEFVKNLNADGGTNINDALLTAIKGAGNDKDDRPYMVIFLTDGRPTIGTQKTKEILSNISGARPAQVRLFVFGVGYDVNTQLLDLLAEQNRGAREYVTEDEELEMKLSGFYRKVSEPVLADVTLEFGDLEVRDVFPPRIQDLFAGTELIVAGRYKGEGDRALKLSGSRRGEREHFIFESTFPAVSTKHEFLPRLWATRKVGYLLDQMRLHGESQEVKDNIVELATRYGIVTPYTAYLVTEPGSVARRGSEIDPDTFSAAMQFPEQQSRLDRRRAAMRRPALAPGPGMTNTNGKEAVELSRATQRMRQAEREEDAADDAEGKKSRKVERIGDRTFYLIEGTWTDSSRTKEMETKKLTLFSDEYFAFLREHPEIARCFALGDRVIVVVDGTAYETVPDEKKP